MNSTRLFRPVVACARQGGASSMRQRLFHSSRALSVVYEVKAIEEFRSAVKKKRLVILDCFAEWCGPCKAISPFFHKLSDHDDFKDKVHFVKFDVDKLPELSQELGIRAMPTFIIFENGKKVGEIVGADPQRLLSKIGSIMCDGPA